MSYKIKAKQVDLSGITGSSLITTTPNSGIALGSSGTSAAVTVDTIYNTAVADTVTSVVVGGASAHLASYWKEKTIVGVLDEILFPLQFPIYKIPTISIAGSPSTAVYEIGATLTSPTLTLTGVKNDAGAFTYLLITKNINAGVATPLQFTNSPSSSSATSLPAQFGYSDPNNPNYSYSLAYTDSALTALPAPGAGSTTSTVVYSGSGSYGTGLVLNDSTGSPDGRAYQVRSTTAPQAAGTNFGSNSFTLTGYYPYFWGVANTKVTDAQIEALIEAGDASVNKVIANSAGTLTIAFNATGQYPWFAIPKEYATKTVWYENALNNGIIGGLVTDPLPNLFVAPINRTVTSASSYWTTDYKVYAPGKITTAGTLQIS